MKSYGRAPTFLLRTGYEQVRSVVAALTGDAAGAAAVEWELPATGVCSSGILAERGGASCAVRMESADEPAASCCGAAEPRPIPLTAAR